MSKGKSCFTPNQSSKILFYYEFQVSRKFGSSSAVTTRLTTITSKQNFARRQEVDDQNCSRRGEIEAEPEPQIETDRIGKSPNDNTTPNALS